MECILEWGISNPLEVMEQMTYLLFIRRLDELQLIKEKKANRLNQPIVNPIFDKNEDDLHWSRFIIPTPALLSKVVDLVADVPMDDKDTKGDAEFFGTEG